MKKVKGMLAGIIVLAVIGGAFAFKAKNAYGVNVYYTTLGTTSCNIKGVSFTLTHLVQPVFPTEYHVTIANAPTTCNTLGFLTTKN